MQWWQKYKTQWQSPPYRGALLSASIMAFAGFGDALLYPVLPVYAESMGISALGVGVLLSINRFMRIGSNAWIATVISTVGMKKTLFVASLGAVCTTLLYGMQWGIVVFVLARVVWGISYSGLLLSTLQYAACVQERSGTVFGIVQSIKTLGTVFALGIGSILIGMVGIGSGMVIVGMCSIPAVVLAWKLPIIDIPPVKTTGKIVFSFESLNLLICVLAVAIDGVIVVTLPALFHTRYTTASELVMAVGFYGMLKRLFIVLFATTSGILADKFSSLAVFNISVVFCLIALLFVGVGWVAIGIIAAFFFNVAIVTLSPVVALSASTQNRQTILARTSTWWDIGAAIGTLVGIVAMQHIGRELLFGGLALCVLLFFVRFLLQYGIYEPAYQRIL